MPNQKLVLFGLLVISFQTSRSLPQDEGCIRIKDCPAAIAHVRNIKTDGNSLRYLEAAHCGFQGLEPVVKCNSIPSLSNVGQSTEECVPLQDCPAALQLIETRVFDPAVTNLLRGVHCGQKNLQPLVKCKSITF